MTVPSPVLVLKFGGASVSTPDKFSKIAEIICERRRFIPAIVVAVSAMGNSTNEFIALAKEVHPNPPARELDMLVSVGERISMSLLAMALHAQGVSARSLTGSQCGIITSNNHTEAKILEVRPRRIENTLQEGHIAIVAGFQGMSQAGEITTLGRGGTDTTAVALAASLGAHHVEFYKDVDGVYEEDPKISPTATLCPFLNYQDALALMHQGAKVLHDRCIELARKNNVYLHVLPFSSKLTASYIQPKGTLIAPNEQCAQAFRSQLGADTHRLSLNKEAPTYEN